jgi:sodium/bile acid cotransporter 7
MILFVTPLILVPLHFLSTFGFSTLLTQGLCIFCSVPTTLSSGVVLVEAAGGNVQLALLLTTLTNSIGVVTIPFMVSYIFRETAQIDRLAIFHELVTFVLVPLVCGVVLRFLSDAVREKVDSVKPSLTMFNNSLILFTVWMTVSQAQPQVLRRTPLELIALVVLAFVVHLIFLAAALVVSKGFDESISRCLIVMISQKSLPKCIMLISALPPAIAANAGVLLIPCIVGHAVQLLFDAYMVSRWPPVEEASKLLPK